MRAKLESQDRAEQGDKTKILHIEFLRWGRGVFDFPKMFLQGWVNTPW